jgi:hypothetical protein
VKGEKKDGCFLVSPFAFCFSPSSLEVIHEEQGHYAHQLLRAGADDSGAV